MARSNNKRRRPRRRPESSLDALVSACSSGDLGRLRDLNKIWRSLSQQWIGLAVAINNQRLDVIAYLLDESVDINPRALYPAIRLKLIPIFDTLVAHGWDINQNEGALPVLT